MLCRWKCHQHYQEAQLRLGGNGITVWGRSPSAEVLVARIGSGVIVSCSISMAHDATTHLTAAMVHLLCLGRLLGAAAALIQREPLTRGYKTFSEGEEDRARSC